MKLITDFRIAWIKTIRKLSADIGEPLSLSEARELVDSLRYSKWDIDITPQSRDTLTE